jgi:hypothetical protein
VRTFALETATTGGTSYGPGWNGVSNRVAASGVTSVLYRLTRDQALVLGTFAEALFNVVRGFEILAKCGDEFFGSVEHKVLTADLD